MATLPTIKTYKQESVKKVYEAIEYNKTAFDKREDFIYVLDTNALLKIFALDKTSFAQLKSVFEHKRFYATHQIETEFLRNRENVSKQYYFYNRKRFVEKYKYRYRRLVRTDNLIDYKRVNWYSTILRISTSKIVSI